MYISVCVTCISMYGYITCTKSADPGLRQGRGGAWDHRRCGACFCWLATTLPSARHSGHCPLLLRAFKPASSRHSGHCPVLLRAFKPAVCHLKRCAAALSRHSRHCPLLPLARPQMPKTLRGRFEQALRPLPSVVKGVQACRLPGLKCLKRARQLRAGTQATALCC